MLFSLDGEIMEKVKSAYGRAFVPAAEWVRRLAEETTAFEIVNAVEEKATRADQRKVRWDQVITLSVKPDQRQVDVRFHVLGFGVLRHHAALDRQQPLGAGRSDAIDNAFGAIIRCSA